MPAEEPVTMGAAEAKQETLYTECGARTNFAPPRAALERTKVCDVDGRTMFDVYEPRYHIGESTPGARKRTEATPAPTTLLELLESRPGLVLAVLFCLVLATSATVTALVQR